MTIKYSSESQAKAAASKYNSFRTGYRYDVVMAPDCAYSLAVFVAGVFIGFLKREA